MFTSLELSKKLSVNGFAGESEYCYLLHDDGTHSVVRSEDYSNNIKKAYMYDILNDLCVKYAKEIYPKDTEKHTCKILEILQKGGDANDYIEKTCAFTIDNAKELV